MYYRDRMPLKPHLRFTILSRDRFRCVYCGRTSQAALLEVDHVVPKSAGGTNRPDNLVTSCERCNSGKAGSVLRPELWDELRDRVFMNHPSGASAKESK
jgi:5-methylcytosine-specific restriction endonuclease McrA